MPGSRASPHCPWKRGSEKTCRPPPGESARLPPAWRWTYSLPENPRMARFDLNRWRSGHRTKGAAPQDRVAKDPRNNKSDQFVSGAGILACRLRADKNVCPPEFAGSNRPESLPGPCQANTSQPLGSGAGNAAPQRAQVSLSRGTFCPQAGHFSSDRPAAVEEIGHQARNAGQ